MPKIIEVALVHILRGVTATVAGVAWAYVMQTYTTRVISKKILDQWAIAVMLGVSICVTFLYYTPKTLLQGLYEPIGYWLFAVLMYNVGADKIVDFVVKLIRRK